MKLKLYRQKTSDAGTFGQLNCGDITFHTAELPWRNNERSVSCIPAGTYTVKPHNSAKFGDCYILENVPGRSNILIHVGNYAGDVSLGYKSDVEGCILIGETVSYHSKQPMITNSRKSFEKFKQLVGRESFELEIINNY